MFIKEEKSKFHCVNNMREVQVDFEMTVMFISSISCSSVRFAEIKMARCTVIYCVPWMCLRCL